jgi:hypothetical protein
MNEVGTHHEAVIDELVFHTNDTVVGIAVFQAEIHPRVAQGGNAHVGDRRRGRTRQEIDDQGSRDAQQGSPVFMDITRHAALELVANIVTDRSRRKVQLDVAQVGAGMRQ